MSDKMSEVEAAKRAVLAVHPRAVAEGRGTVFGNPVFMAGDTCKWLGHNWIDAASRLLSPLTEDAPKTQLDDVAECRWCHFIIELRQFGEGIEWIHATNNRKWCEVEPHFAEPKVPASPVGELEGALEEKYSKEFIKWWCGPNRKMNNDNAAQRGAYEIWNASSALSSNPAPEGIPERPKFGFLNGYGQQVYTPKSSIWSELNAYMDALEAIISAKDAEIAKFRDDAKHYEDERRSAADFMDMPESMLPVTMEGLARYMEYSDTCQCRVCAHCRLIISMLSRAEASEALVATRDADIVRLTDLVRHQRNELHAEKLISEEEFAALVADSDGGQRVARMETYDGHRAKYEAELDSLRASSEAKDFDILRLLECMKGIRASFGLAPHEVMDVMTATCVPAEVEHNLRSSSAKVREEGKAEGLCEAAKIASSGIYNGDYPNWSTDSGDEVCRWISARILSLLPTSPESQEAASGK